MPLLFPLDFFERIAQDLLPQPGEPVAEGNGDVIINQVPGLIKTGFEFDVSDSEENNLILLQKGNDELTALVNKSLAKAYEAGYYPKWYAEAKEMAGLDTAEEVVIEDSTEAASN